MKRPHTGFARRLRQFRRRNNMTQRELAKAIGYSPTHIAQIERSQRAPSPAFVNSIIAVFDLPVRAWHRSGALQCGWLV